MESWQVWYAVYRLTVAPIARQHTWSLFPCIGRCRLRGDVRGARQPYRARMQRM